MKIIKYSALAAVMLFILVVLASMYKFNNLASQPGYDVDGNRVDINNFDDCVRAGYPAMESYPEQCSDGEQTFVNGEGIQPDDEQPIPVEPDNGIGDEAEPLDELIDIEAQFQKQVETSENLDFRGLSLEDAQALAQQNSIPFRVVEQDGEMYAVTMDYRPGRINAVVNNAVVTDFTVEGASQ